MEDIAQLISSLSSDDIDMLKGIADSFLGGDKQDTSSAPKQEQGSDKGDSSFLPFNLGKDDLAMIMKMKSAFEKLGGNSETNANSQLLLALKPHLSEKRQGKADEALKLMQMMDMLPLLKELF